MEKVSGFSVRHLGVVSALVALVASLLVVPGTNAVASTTAKENCDESTTETELTFGGGSGDEETPFLISSAGNLETLRDCVNSGNSTYNASTVYYEQTADIDWIDDSPIGTSSETPFAANYDGSGHTIHSFAQSLDRDATKTDGHGVWAGLFGGGEDCTIENLTVSGAITVDTTSGSYGTNPVAYAGILMGESLGCTVRDVNTFGTITATGEDDRYDLVGGMVGRAILTDNSVIENSTSHVDINTVDVRYVGGAIGLLSGENSASEHTILNVSASPAEDASAGDVSRGKITVTVSTASFFVGGLVGYLDGKNSSESSNIWESWSSVPIVAPSDGDQVQNVGTNHYFGGLVGGAPSDWYGSVRESFSSSPVTLDLTAGSGGVYVGGLFGYIAASSGFEIRDSYSISALEVDNNGTFSGWNQLGGLIGQTHSSIAPTRDELINSFFRGSLTPTASNSKVAGIDGRRPETSIPNSYANSDVPSSSLLDDDGFSTQSSFTDWDFNDIWVMGGEHPVHQWAIPDTTPPTLDSTTPATDATGVTVSDSVVLTFNENIAAGTGDLRVYSDATCSTLDQTIDVTDSDRVTVSGSTATVSFADPNELAYGVLTCIEIDSGAITDAAGNSYSGLAKPNGLNFTTEPTVPQAPVITGTTAGNGQLTVAFTQGSDGGAAISDYKYSLNGGSYEDFDPDVTTSPAVITDLTNGTAYTVRLIAVNSVGDSAASNALTGTPVAPVPSPSPGTHSDPDPEPTPEPEAEPETTPAPRPAITPTPPVEPPTETTPVQPTTTPAPTPQPAADPAPEAEPPVTGAGAVVVRSEELFEGQITVSPDTDEVIMPAVVLEDIANRLVPAGAPLTSGSLLIESGTALVVVLMVQLGDVRLTAADLGDSIQFTLNIPGFEPSSMSVAVQKQTLVWAFWAQMGLFALSALVALIILWMFIARRRRRQQSRTADQRLVGAVAAPGGRAGPLWA